MPPKPPTPPTQGSNVDETMPPKPPQTKEKESSQTVHYTATKTNAKKRHMDHIISEADKKNYDSFETLSNVLKTKKREEDECDVYASLLAKKLRKYPERMRDRIMYKIDGLFWITLNLMTSDHQVPLRLIQCHLPMLNKHFPFQFQLRLHNISQLRLRNMIHLFMYFRPKILLRLHRRLRSIYISQKKI